MSDIWGDESLTRSIFIPELRKKEKYHEYITEPPYLISLFRLFGSLPAGCRQETFWADDWPDWTYRADVAERIGMSRSYFSTRFKEMTGETFHQYVIHRKMKTAAEWIEEGKKSITRIAVELGYDNFHYFAKVFAREHGCTPSEYRKESKNVWFSSDIFFVIKNIW